MVNFASDTEMLDIVRDKLYASVISDVIDSLGARNQGVRLDVRPIYEGAMVVGRAYPVLTADVYKFIDDPYGPEIDAVDSLKHNDVMVVCTQRSTRTCFWGDWLPPPQGPGAPAASSLTVMRETLLILPR